MPARAASFNRGVPILSVDLVEDRFRFTSTLTSGVASLMRLSRASNSGKSDPFGRIIMDRAPQLAEQAGLIGNRRLALSRKSSTIYNEPITLRIR